MPTLKALALACTLLLAAVALNPVGAQTAPPRMYLPLVAGQALTASYLGGPADDAVTAVDFDRSGRPLLAGRWPGQQIGGVTPGQPGAGEGALVRLTPAGKVEAAIRLAGPVGDMEASAAGPVIACGPFGVAAVDESLATVIWSDKPGAATRCSAGSAGGAAALVGESIFVYGPGGAGRTSWTVRGAADLALDERSGLVFVTGYTQKTSVLKVAYLRGYDQAGTLRWTAYDFEAAALSAAGLSADSEGRRVALGADGKLYLAGWTDGGNSLFGRDPANLGRTPGRDELVKFDAYNDPFNLKGAKALAWYGRFEPADGRLIAGQWLLTRLSDGTGNSIAIYGIDADASGAVALAGEAYASLAGRDGMRFRGFALGPYEGGEPFVLVTSPDLKARRLWTALAAPGSSAGGSPASGVATAGGYLALGVTLNQRTSGAARGLITTGTPNVPPGGSDGYFLLMGMP